MFWERMPENSLGSNSDDRKTEFPWSPNGAHGAGWRCLFKHCPSIQFPLYCARNQNSSITLQVFYFANKHFTIKLILCHPTKEKRIKWKGALEICQVPASLSGVFSSNLYTTRKGRGQLSLNINYLSQAYLLLKPYRHYSLVQSQPWIRNITVLTT